MKGIRKTAMLLLAALTLLCGCQTHEHTWTGPTCTEPKTCTQCGETEGEPLGHDYSEATCTEPKTCTRCGQTEGEPKGHDFSEATCTEPKTCTRCGQTEGEPKGHDFSEATCTEPGTCTRCGQTEGEPKGHDFTEPTCTEAGVCRRCGETTPAKGHDWRDATCLRPKTCARCGLTEGEALGHDMADGVCTRCGYRIFEPMRGKGNAVLTGIQTGSGIFRAHIRQISGSDFTVWAYDAQGAADLLTFVRGSYDGSVLLFGTAPYTLEVFSNASWEITVEQLDKTDAAAFAGTGDAVTDLFAGQSGAYRFAYDGENDFVVWLYTADGETLLIQELGACSTERTVSVPENGLAFFVIRADAAWTIEPLDR